MRITCGIIIYDINPHRRSGVMRKTTRRKPIMRTYRNCKGPIRAAAAMMSACLALTSYTPVFAAGTEKAPNVNAVFQSNGTNYAIVTLKDGDYATMKGTASDGSGGTVMARDLTSYTISSNKINYVYFKDDSGNIFGSIETTPEGKTYAVTYGENGSRFSGETSASAQTKKTSSGSAAKSETSGTIYSSNKTVTESSAVKNTDGTKMTVTSNIFMTNGKSGKDEKKTAVASSVAVYRVGSDGKTGALISSKSKDAKTGSENVISTIGSGDNAGLYSQTITRADGSKTTETYSGKAGCSVSETTDSNGKTYRQFNQVTKDEKGNFVAFTQTGYSVKSFAEDASKSASAADIINNLEKSIKTGDTGSTSGDTFNKYAAAYNALNNTVNEGYDKYEAAVKAGDTSGYTADEKKLYTALEKNQQLRQELIDAMNKYGDTAETALADAAKYKDTAESINGNGGSGSGSGSGGNGSGTALSNSGASTGNEGSSEDPANQAASDADQAASDASNEFASLVKKLPTLTPTPVLTVTPTTATDTTGTDVAKKDAAVKEALNELASATEMKYDEQTFKDAGITVRQGDAVGDAQWRYYISTDLEIVSQVTDYSVYGLTGVMGTTTSADQYGTKSAYSYVYDVDGNILKDSVAKSTQTGLGIVSASGADIAYIREIGKGNQTNYSTEGFANITLDGLAESKSQLGAKVYISGNRKNTDSQTTVNTDAASTVTVPDTVKTVARLLADKMYDTNKSSFVMNNAGSVISTSDAASYKVVASGSTGTVVYYDEVTKDGYKRTWSYCIDQEVVKSDGTRIPVQNALEYDIYSVSDLISHGFVCKVNGTAATSEDASNLSVKPSALASGQKSGSEGKLADNDSESVKPTDGSSEKAVAVLDKTKSLDIANAYSEYIYSSNNYDYYMPEGVNEAAQIVFKDQNGKTKTLTVASALAQKYMNADQFVKAMGKIGVTVTKVAKTSANPDFTVSVKGDSSADTTMTEIFRDDKYIYSVPGSTYADRTVIVCADGRKLRLKYVLEHNMYTIDKLKQKGAEIYEKLIPVSSSSSSASSASAASAVSASAASAASSVQTAVSSSSASASSSASGVSDSAAAGAESSAK